MGPSTLEEFEEGERSKNLDLHILYSNRHRKLKVIIYLGDAREENIHIVTGYPADHFLSKERN